MFPSRRRLAPPNRENRAIDARNAVQGGDYEMRDFGSQRANLYGSTAPQTPFEMPPPDEESIQTLMVNTETLSFLSPYCNLELFKQGLGFEREAVIRALRASGNNVDAAANRLFS
jgi:hypothetical protein